MSEGEARKRLLDHIEHDALNLLSIRDQCKRLELSSTEIIQKLTEHTEEMERALKEDFTQGIKT